MSELIVDLLLFLHFLGLAVLLGGLMVQLTPSLKAARSLVTGGAITQLLTGIGLLAMLMADVNHLKVTVKLAFAVLILVVALISRRKPFSRAFWVTMAGLSVSNLGVAVFW
jgi:hypothetical protein